ncbi:hypothetical protein HYV87_00745 [Candidatus Woesearchaeota archaeon]|nr:hypothetical protein [Candidatus Woesearchaeota archaeon]
MSIATRIIFYVIPLLLLVVVSLVFFGQSGAWEDLKDAVLGASKLLPEVKVGLEEQKAEVSIPDTHRESVGRIENTINNMLGSGKENCFAKYGKLSELGEAGTSLTFELKGDKTSLTVRGGSGGKQIITDLYAEFTKMKPCVIAGPGRITENFRNYFLLAEEPLLHPYYHPVSSLTFFYSTSGVNENSISVPELGLVNDLNDNGYLFTPDGEHICFFPTNDFGDDDEGLADVVFTQEGFFSEESIPTRIKEGKLKSC